MKEQEEQKRERGYCERCDTYTFLERHHVLPKSVFGGFGRIVELCPTCHNEYHTELGRKNLRNKDADYHQFKFWKWYHTATFVFVALIGLLATLV